MLPKNQQIEILNNLIDIAIGAGKEIMRHYGTNLDIDYKSDYSPVTEADIAANNFITRQLESHFHWPVLSEEAKIPEMNLRENWAQYWLVDPLDGTKEFIKGNDEFTVNIALVSNHEAILSVVYAPALDQLYYGSLDTGAFKIEKGNTFRLPELDSRINTSWHILTGRSGPKPRLGKLINKVKVSKLSELGSSLKICHIAEGLADFYPRFGLTSEWDTAAAQVILEAVGGYLLDFNGDQLTYNRKDSLLNPEFVALGQKNTQLLQLIKSC